MKEFTDVTVIEEIQKHPIAQQWVRDARERSSELKALVNGDGFDELLITKIEKLESNDRAASRKKYSKDMRDVFFRILKKRDNVFQATGGSEDIKIPSEEQKQQFLDILKYFKGGKSITKYLSEYYFRMVDTDPNGLLFLEYKSDPKLEIYPTYKSINSIRYYEADGQKCEFVIFEPVKVLENQVETTLWRVVDSKKDWCIKQTGTTFIIDTEKTFTHEFGEVPAVILSDYIKVGYRDRLSPLTPITELAKDYARDKSILTIYKFQNGFPKHWQYVTQCRKCHGTGKTGTSKCGDCDGSGHLGRKDVTDQINLAIPKEGDPTIAPNIAGFIAPDLETWKQYKVDLRDMEMIMEDTLWGTDTFQQSKNDSETATGRFIDVQPITNELNKQSDCVEWVHNTLANWVANMVLPLKKKDESVFHKSYGRRFIIESPDVVLERYEKSREAGENSTVLDKLLQEFILSKYKTDPIMQDHMLKKSVVEPYIHYSTKDVFDFFGREEALKKALFVGFWNEVDTSQEPDKLKADFDVYFAKEKVKYVVPVTEQTPPSNQ